MTDMQGNPHYRFAMDQIDCVEDMTSQEQIQADATLALAFEQRTANLIALYSMNETNAQGMVDGADVTSENWVDVTKQIKERLGLK